MDMFSKASDTILIFTVSGFASCSWSQARRFGDGERQQVSCRDIEQHGSREMPSEAPTRTPKCLLFFVEIPFRTA